MCSLKPPLPVRLCNHPPRFLTKPRIWLNSSPSHEPQAGTGFRQGELSFFWTPWGNLCDAGVRSNSYDPFQDTWREGDEYDVSRYKGKGPFFSEAGPSTLAAVQNGLQGQMPPLCPPPSGEFQGIFSGAPGSTVSPSF